MMSRKRNIGIMLMLVFMIMNFVLSLSGTLFNGILDKIAIEMNISVAKTGYLTSFYAYGAIGAPLVVLLFKRIEKTTLLKIMLVLNIIFGYISITSDSFGLLLFSRLMLGIVGTTYGVLATTIVASLSSKDRVGSNLAFLITGAALSMMIGIPLCRLLINYYSWQNIYFVLIALMICGLGYYIFNLNNVNISSGHVDFKHEMNFFRNKDVIRVLLSSLFVFIGYGAFNTYATPYIVERFPNLESVMSVILFLMGFSCFIGNLIGGRICDRIGYCKALVIGSIGQIVTGLIIFFSGIWWLCILFILILMFNGWFNGLQLNTGINVACNRKSSLLVSINGSIIQFAQALGASISAILISNFGIDWIVMLLIMCSVIVVIILYGGVRQNIYRENEDIVQ